jgi:Cd2+/Zn2+-exporting ATPase
MFDAGRRFDRLYLVLRQTLGMIAKYLDYSAISNTTAAALRNHSLEFGLERLQTVDAGLHLLKLMLRNAVSSRARPIRVVCQCKKCADRVQREPQFTAVADKGQPLNVPAPKAPLIAVGAYSFWHQADQARPFCQLADAEILLDHACVHALLNLQLLEVLSSLRGLAIVRLELPMPDAHAHEHDSPSKHEHGVCCSGEVSVTPTAAAFRAGRAYKVHGMDCAEEVAMLRQAVGPVIGGPDRLVFDVLNGRMTVADDAREVPEEAILKAIASTGLSAAAWAGQAEKGQTYHRRQRALFTAGSGLCVLIGLGLHVVIAGGAAEAWKLLGSHAGQPTPWPAVVAYLAAVLLGGRFVIVKAWYAVRSLRPDMNLLMTVAVLGAMVIGEWFEAATVSFLFALSLAIESWSVGRARRAISELLDLAPPTARLLCSDGSEAVVAVAEVKTGDLFVVPPGERIALDGRIVAGTSSVNQAPITGESVPVEKEPGTKVFAGTINGDGALTVEATRPATDTTLGRIIHMVEEAHARRAPSEQWVERFARVYTPAVMAAAILVFLLPPLALGQSWGHWFYRALVLLIIACPCALVISTPVSIVASLASAARAGVLVKGGAFIELPARLRAIAMDKTGTITRAEPEVIKVVPLGNHTEAELIARAAALEARSTHPLARAVLCYAEQHGIALQAATSVQVSRGKGLTGRFDGETFWLGSHRYVTERRQDTPETNQQADALEADGNTVIVVGNSRHVCGLIAVADTIRPEAREVVNQLHGAGVAHVLMLTGDNRVTAEAIARQVGIDEVHAELLPEDKINRIEELIRRYGTVAMVGDGVNDAPALARANLGIAMGAIGSDAAIETADIALMTDDVSKLPWIVRHAQWTLRVIRQNITLSLGIKAAFLLLTFAGMASLWGAIAADMGASLLVVFNGLRLLRPNRPKNRS